MGIFPQIVQEFLGIAPDSCIWIEYVFSGILFLTMFVGLVIFLWCLLFSMFGLLRRK